MVNLKQIRDLVIEPALKAVDMHSAEAADLLLFTGLQESRYIYVKQIGGGPACSFWQVEPATMIDHYRNYIGYRDTLRLMIEDIQKEPSEDALISNMAFAVIMARLVYRRSKIALPAVGDGPGMAHIWKEVYNTHKGHGTEQQFLYQWEQYKGDLY